MTGASKLAIHLFHAPLVNGSRVEKEAYTLVDSGIASEVLIIGYWKPGLLTTQYWREQTRVRRIKLLRFNSVGSWIINLNSFLAKLVMMVSICQFYLKAFLITIWNRPHFVACHNLLLLPLAVSVKLCCGARLVYVPHELETHRTNLSGMLRLASQFIEWALIRFADSTIVVCDPIAEWYEKKYRIPVVEVVPNVPYHPSPGKMITRTKLLREHFSIPDKDIIFIYQGLVNKGRGVEDLLQLFRKLPRHLHLVIMGYGDLADTVRATSLEFKNIHFKEAVPVEEIIPWTSSADVGLFFNSKPMTLSYQYSLPNKFFEYSIAGLYIIISNNFIEQSENLKRHKLGETVPPSLDALESAIRSLTKEQISANIEASIEFRRSIGWQNFDDVYRRAYLGVG